MMINHSMRYEASVRSVPPTCASRELDRGSEGMCHADTLVSTLFEYSVIITAGREDDD